MKVCGGRLIRPNSLFIFFSSGALNLIAIAGIAIPFGLIVFAEDVLACCTVALVKCY